MKIPARRYQLALLFSLLVLSGFTIYAHKALEAPPGSYLNPFSRAAKQPATSGGPADNIKTATQPNAAAATGSIVTATSAAALTNDFFITEEETASEMAFEPLQSGGGFNISPSIVAGGGGGGPSSGGTNTVTGSVGQSALGAASGGNFSVAGGFWGGVGGGGCQVIAISPASLPAGQMSVPYSQQLSQVGGAAPLTWSISQGNLPNNITLNPTTGLLSGTPVVTGTFNFTVSVTDSSNCPGSQAYSLVISSCPTITVTPASLPGASSFTFYSQQLFASGGAVPYNFTVSVGALPAGLTLTTGGLLSGAPTVSGPFNFTVRATDVNTCFGDQSYMLLITANSGLMFYPLSKPIRLLDTRPGGNCDNVSTPISAGTSITALAHTTCEGITIPQAAQAIVGNVTVINQTAQIGYLTLYPTGQNLPVAANMIYGPGDLLSNNFTVGLDNTGQFNIFGERMIDVVVDVSGYYAPPGAGGLYFHPLSQPIRLVDTRAGQGNCDNINTPIAAGTSLTTIAAPRGCEGLTIPAAAQAITGNATVINGSGQSGYLTIYPDGVAPPLAANMIYQPGSVLSNAFTVGLSNAGKFNIFGEKTIDIAIDVAGYYSTEPTDVNGLGLLFNPLMRPLRILDTRANQGNCDAVGAPIAAGTSIAALGRLTCEGITIPTTAQAIIGNVTVINQTASAGYMTMYPDGVSAPLAANMIYTPNQLLSNAFVVGLNAGNGQYRIFGERTIEAIVDAAGYFAP